MNQPYHSFTNPPNEHLLSTFNVPSNGPSPMLGTNNARIIRRNILMSYKKMRVTICFNGCVMKHWQDQSYHLPAIILI